jgi:bacterioferritin
MPEANITRAQLIDALNEDLSREYQAVIAYVNYSQVLKGAAYMSIADQLEIHAKQELDHALKVANAIDYLGGMPSVTPKPVKTSEKAEDMLKFDLENERVTIANYRRRVRQCDTLNEFARPRHRSPGPRHRRLTTVSLHDGRVLTRPSRRNNARPQHVVLHVNLLTALQVPRRNLAP